MSSPTNIKGLIHINLLEENGNNNKSMNNLALRYYNGEGTEKNLEKAFYLYQKAAENGYIIAQYNLAMLYYNGEGTEKNLETAFHWYQKAAERDHITAQHNLGYLYYS